MSMKKILLLSVLVLALALVGTACKGKSEITEPTAPPEQAAPKAPTPPVTKMDTEDRAKAMEGGAAEKPVTTVDRLKGAEGNEKTGDVKVIEKKPKAFQNLVGAKQDEDSAQTGSKKKGE
jgi:hypothetical protein